jgi:subtilisin family serine protease
MLKFKSHTLASERLAIKMDLGGQTLRTFSRTGAELVSLRNMTVEEAIRRYGSHRDLHYLEPNYIVRANVLPNDPMFSELWGMRNTGQTGGVSDADIDADEAWELSTGSRSVVVGVLDTGVDYSHPDLAANMWTNSAETPDNGIDDDGNGFVDDYRGWDFANGDNDPIDDHNHGTHCAGIIGAVGDNGIGVVGVNWEVSICPLKFLAACG